MRKYMLFNPLSGPPWEYPAIKSKELSIPLKRVVYKSSKYSLLKSDSLKYSRNLVSSINIVESPFTENIYLFYTDARLDGIPNKLMRMKIIRQSKEKIEMIGVERNSDMSYSDYAVTIKLTEKTIVQIVFHNFEKEFDYEFDGSISNKSNYDKRQLKKDVPDNLLDAVKSFQKDNYKPLLEYLLAKYPYYYKIYYIIGVLLRNIYYLDDAIKMNKKFADAYDFKLTLLKGEGVEMERYNTLKLIVKYRKHLSPLIMTFLPVKYLVLAEIEKDFGNNKKSWKYLSKYFSISHGHIADAYYLRATLFYEMKKYARALKDINECIKEEKNQKNYFLRAQIREATGDVEGSRDDMNEAKKLEENNLDTDEWIVI